MGCLDLGVFSQVANPVTQVIDGDEQDVGPGRQPRLGGGNQGAGCCTEQDSSLAKDKQPAHYSHVSHPECVKGLEEPLSTGQREF
jgi:hypothetical protein